MLCGCWELNLASLKEQKLTNGVLSVATPLGIIDPPSPNNHKLPTALQGGMGL